MSIDWSIVFVVSLSLLVGATNGYFGCTDPLIPCSNKTDCIRINEICLDHRQCNDQSGKKIACDVCKENGSDYMSCVTQIHPHIEYECLSPTQICDKQNDCIDKSDEIYCGITVCNINKWLCKNGTCIDKSQICDGHPDCPDESDESSEFCHSSRCSSPDQRRCHSGECISSKKLCDGVVHCSDGSDEIHCPKSTLPPTSTPVNNSSCSEYTCSTSLRHIHPICITNDRVCDGQIDCPEDDDEVDCSHSCISNSTCTTSPDIKCVKHPTLGQLCRCVKTGYRWLPNPHQNHSFVCQDFNECSDPNRTYCSYNCVNTDGGFNCTCPSGFEINEIAKSCLKINDPYKPDILVVLKDRIISYNIQNATHYSPQALETLDIDPNYHFDRMQYDYVQKFALFYDDNRRSIFCNVNTNLLTITLISNISVQAFVYNAQDRTLFIIEQETRTLRVYAPINCHLPFTIKMHAWSLAHILVPINSMEIDIYDRKLIFAFDQEFMISNMNQPTEFEVAHTTERRIQHFTYDASFKRIFWTERDPNAEGFFVLQTCDGEFRQCHDTSIRLPSSWPFAFFNDALLYSPLSLNSINAVQIYGTARFTPELIVLTPEPVRTFLRFDHRAAEVSSPCDYVKNECHNDLCLTNTSKTFICVPVNQTISSDDYPHNSAIMNTNIDSVNGAQPLINEPISTGSITPRKRRFAPSSIILVCIMLLGLAGIISAIFVRRCHNRLNQNTLDEEHRQHQQRLSADDAQLEEFTLMVDDRVRSHAQANDLRTDPMIVGSRRKSI